MTKKKNSPKKKSARPERVESMFNVQRIEHEQREVKKLLEEILIMQSQIIQNAFRIQSLVNRGKDSKIKW